MSVKEATILRECAVKLTALKDCERAETKFQEHLLLKFDTENNDKKLNSSTDTLNLSISECVVGQGVFNKDALGSPTEQGGFNKDALGGPDQSQTVLVCNVMDESNEHKANSDLEEIEENYSKMLRECLFKSANTMLALRDCERAECQYQKRRTSVLCSNHSDGQTSLASSNKACEKLGDANHPDMSVVDGNDSIEILVSRVKNHDNEPVNSISTATNTSTVNYATCETQTTFCERNRESYKNYATKEIQTSPGEYSDISTQTTAQFTQCCQCDAFSLPLPEQVGLRLKEEVSKRLTLEQLCKIVEQEAREMRMKFIAEQNKFMDLQNDLQDLKCELMQERHLAAEYKTHNDELKQSLEGSYTMISKLEEQAQTTNIFKGGVDSFLESKLASSRAAEAQTKVEVLQNELVQSKQEVQHLLQRLSDANRDRGEMVSNSVHNELLKIADDRAKLAEFKVHQLQNEMRQLKQSSGGSSAPLRPSAIHGASDLLGHAHDRPVKSPQKMKPSAPCNLKNSSSASKEKRSNFHQGKEKMVKFKNDTPVLPPLPDFDVLHPPKVKTPEKPSKPLVPTKPLFVTNESEESDWSSEDDQSVQSVSSIKKKWEKRSSHDGSATDKPLSSPGKPTSPTKSLPKPPVPRKPKLPPKPNKPSATPTPAEPVILPGMEEKPIFFDHLPTSTTLKTYVRPRGAGGRRLPTRDKR